MSPANEKLFSNYKLQWIGIAITLGVTLIGWTSATLGWVANVGGDKRQATLEVQTLQARTHELEVKTQAIEVKIGRIEEVVVWIKDDRVEEKKRQK